MNNQMPLISVIVPIYNMEKYLNQCIDSIIDQSYENLEIILVDDGSTDSSFEICNEYKEKDNRIIVIHKKNGGLVSARKKGLELANGEYIAYVDSDDWINRNMYMEMYNNGIIYDAEVIVTENTRVMPNGRHIEEKINLEGKIYEKQEIINKIIPIISDTTRFFTWGISLTIWRFLIKKDLLTPILYNIDECIKMGEDIAATLPSILAANSLAFVPGYFYYYRQSENSMKRTAKKKEYISTFKLYNHLCYYVNKYKFKEIIKDKLVEHTLKILLISSFNLFIDNNRDEIEVYHIKKNSNIAIYGAGIYGAEVYNRLKESNFCNIVSWTDTNYDTYNNISSPEILKKDNYDYILLAITFYESRMAVKEKIIKMGIDPSKIADIDVRVLTENTLKKIAESKQIKLNN